MTPAPARILIARAGSAADWIRTEPLLRLIRAQFPAAVVAVTLREGQADLLRLLGPELRVLTLRFDPRGGPQAAELAQLQDFRRQLAAFAPAWVIAPAPSPTWFEEWIAIECAGAHRIGMARSAGYTPFDRSVPVADDASERAQLEAFAQVVFSAEWPGPPQLDLTVTRAEAERDLQDLAALQLEPGRFAACAAGGTAVEWQAWPVAHYAEVIARLERDAALPTLLCGTGADRGRLEAIGRAANALGAKPRIWLAEPGEFPRLVNLVALARCCLGHESDLLHAAVAAGVPALGIFGGGSWPARPLWGAAPIATVVQPLACFGCGWECRYGNAPCLQSLPVETVAAAVPWLLAARPGEQQTFEVPAERGLNTAVVQFIARQAEVSSVPPPAPDLPARLAEAESAAAQAALARGAMEVRLAELEREQTRAAEDAESRLTASEQARAEALEAARRLRSEREERAAALVGLESELAARRAEAIALTEELREVVRQRDTHEAAATVWEQRDAERSAELQTLREAREAAVAQESVLRERIAQVETELGEWRDRAEARAAELTEAQAKLTAGAANWQAQIGRIESERDDWKQQAEARAAELIEAQAKLTAEAANWQAQIGRIESERDDWKQQAEARAGELAVAQAGRTAAETDLASLRARLNEQGGALGTIMARAAVAEGSLEALRAQHAAAEADRTSQRLQIARQAEEAESLRNQLESQRQQLDAQRQQLDSQREQLEALGRTLAEKDAQLALPPPVVLPPEAVELEAMRERAARAEGEMQTLRLQQAVVEGASATRVLTLERQAAELERLRALREELETRVSILEKAGEAQREGLARAAEARAAGEQSLTALQKELTAARERSAALEAELSALRAKSETERVAQLEVIGQQGEKLVAAQAAVEELQHRLAQFDESRLAKLSRSLGVWPK